MSRDAEISAAYQQLLRAYIDQPDEAQLAAAAELGRRVSSAGLPVEDVAELHHEATVKLAAELPQLSLVEVAPRLSVPLVELLIAYSLTFSEQRDATALAQTRLRESEEIFRTITTEAQDGIIVTDDGGAIRYWNAAAARIFGRTADEVLGTRLQQLIASSEIDRHLARACSEAPAPVGAKLVELVGLRYDGKEFPLEASLAGVRNRGEWRVVAIARDISARRATERELLRLSTAVRVSKDGVVLTDAAGVITDANDACLELVGESKEAALGSNVLEWVAAADLERARDRLSALRRGIALAAEEFTLIRSDGGAVATEISGALMTDAKGEPAGLVASVRDITERKRAQARERKALAQLDSSARLAAVGELAGGVAHELNNPLSAILTYAALLGEGGAEASGLPAGTREKLETIVKAAERCQQIVDNLLSFASRSEAEMRHVAVAELVARTRELVAPELRMRHIRLRSEVGEAMVWGNARQLQQALTNVLLNAMQAIGEQGEIEIRVGELADAVVIEITDDGPGIPRERLGRVFDPFFSTRGSEGTGLGLSLVRGVVEGHRGTVTIDSLLGRGTTVRIKLPIGPVRLRERVL